MAWDYDGTRRHEHPKTKTGVCVFGRRKISKKERKEIVMARLMVN